MCPGFCHRDAGKGRCRNLFGPAHGMRIWNPEWVPAAPPVALSPWGRSDSYFASVVIKSGGGHIPQRAGMDCHLPGAERQVREGA